jgi:hypothetical protein
MMPAFKDFAASAVEDLKSAGFVYCPPTSIWPGIGIVIGVTVSRCHRWDPFT